MGKALQCFAGNGLQWAYKSETGLSVFIESGTMERRPAYGMLVHRCGFASDGFRAGNQFLGRKNDDFGTPPSPIFSPDVSMEAVMGIYEDFYASHYHDGSFSYNGTRYGTFHYGFNRFAAQLNAAIPDKRIAYVWNNIVKIGKSQGSGFSGEEIYTVEKDCFSVIRKEVDILKPDLILFLTGTYDERIRDNWRDVQFSELSPYAVNEVAQVMSSELPIPAYRTNHPSARLQKGEMEARYRVIIDDFINIRND